MSSPGLSVENAAVLPEDLVEAGHYATFADGSDHGLVVLAMGQPYWLLPSAEGFRLLVEARVAAEIHEQLSRFDRESVGWPPQPIEHRPARPLEFALPLLWALTVFVVFLLQGERPGWTAAGAMDATAVFTRGEWWRALTALFLHADTSHVVANALSGILVFSAVLSTFGRRRGVLALAATAVAGNLAVAAMHYPDAYRSIGASTAVFAGVGLLTGRAIRIVAHSGHPHRWRTIFTPIAAGFTVLGLYGAGGLHSQVDVGAHATGFLAGLLAGLMAAKPSPPAT